MKRNTQADNIITNIKVKIYLTIPEISATKIETWNFHVNESSKGRYDMILGRYILIELVLNLKLSEQSIKEYGGPLKGSMAPMIDLGM